MRADKSDYLGLLIVTPEMVAKIIKAIKENKSPGVDGIPPKLLNKLVYHFQECSLKEGVVPFE